jgi:hypothetical protein
MEVFGNGMTRGTTWEGVEYLVLTKVQIRIALVVYTRAVTCSRNSGVLPNSEFFRK